MKVIISNLDRDKTLRNNANNNIFYNSGSIRLTCQKTPRHNILLLSEKYDFSMMSYHIATYKNEAKWYNFPNIVQYINVKELRKGTNTKLYGNIS